VSDKPKTFKKGIFSYLGKISFGIYIYHNVLVAFVTKIVLLKYNKDFSVYFSVYLASSILIAIISWELFEKQILKFKTRFEIVKIKR
jgi:peptidoglycan/LPS O-acetylase OafA/YrhL